MPDYEVNFGDKPRILILSDCNCISGQHRGPKFFHFFAVESDRA